MTEDEMVGWHHCLSRHEFEQTVGDSDGQRSLAWMLQTLGLQRIRHNCVNNNHYYDTIIILVKQSISL